ncbi:TetR/AcrR family transcriptional regulator, partial [Pseudomonas aeruginosa]
LLMVAPEYALGFFRRIFHDSIVRFQDLLDIVFEEWDTRLGVRLDRELICEMIIRYVLSEVLVPEGSGRRLLPVRVRKLAAALTIGSTSRTRR